MKKIFSFCVKVIVTFAFACVFAILADKISCYHLASVTGFFVGGIFSAYVFGMFNAKTI